MNTQKFIEQLESNPELKTSFYFMDKQLVPDHYHITEIKNIISESVDCGKTKHIEKLTVVQLWATNEDIGKHQLYNNKIGTIFQGIDNALGLNKEAEILFEYGDAQNRTASYKIENIVVEDNALVVTLYVPKTECKPKKLLKSLTSTSCC